MPLSRKSFRRRSAAIGATFALHRRGSNCVCAVPHSSPIRRPLARRIPFEAALPNSGDGRSKAAPRRSETPHESGCARIRRSLRGLRGRAELRADGSKSRPGAAPANAAIRPGWNGRSPPGAIIFRSRSEPAHRAFRRLVSSAVAVVSPARRYAAGGVPAQSRCALP